MAQVDEPGGDVVSNNLAILDALQEQAFESIRRWVTNPARMVAPALRAGLSSSERFAERQTQAGSESQPHLASTTFAAAVDRAKADLRGLVPRLVDLLREILTLRQELLVVKDPPAGLLHDLDALLPPDFLRTTPFSQLAHFPRYLKAMKLRAERWRKNPPKDAERAALLAPCLAAIDRVRAHDGSEAFRWLVEEFRVSLFAQELGTAEPVSAVKLDRALAALQQGGAPAPKTPGKATAPAKPIVAAPLRESKPAAIKNLGALDKLFGR